MHGNLESGSKFCDDEEKPLIKKSLRPREGVKEAVAREAL